MQPVIDIGVNLMHPSFDKDRDQVVKQAEEAGVSALIITGTDAPSSAAACAYAALYPGKLYSTAGVHPHDAKTWDAAAQETVRKLAQTGAACAVGECGLDYNRNFSPPAVQRRCFEQQIALAEACALPLFVHERDAFADVSALLRANRSSSAAVIHCFTGTAYQLEEYLALGCYIGITGWICDERRGGALVALVNRIPPDKLMLETDAPFLFPRSLGLKGRASRNEPRFLPQIAGFIASHLEKDPQVLAQETYANTCRFFGIAL
ncbi:MAG: TatD family hydrolase [Spirochaetaceae bacterium]|nr:TatD family hydrolase [Spirochaetaceae bacterium]